MWNIPFRNSEIFQNNAKEPSLSFRIFLYRKVKYENFSISKINIICMEAGKVYCSYGIQIAFLWYTKGKKNDNGLVGIPKNLKHTPKGRAQVARGNMPSNYNIKIL
jgi:hypothetical protein